MFFAWEACQRKKDMQDGQGTTELHFEKQQGEEGHKRLHMKELKKMNVKKLHISGSNKKESETKGTKIATKELETETCQEEG